MLQKLENAFLQILRVVVIVVAALLLVGVFILGLNSFEMLQAEPEPAKNIPQVSEQDLIKNVTDQPVDGAQSVAPPANAGSVDPNKSYYDRSGLAIKNFIEKQSNGTIQIDQQAISDIVKKRAQSEETPELVAAYAKNLAESIDKILANPAIINAARSSSSTDVVDKIIDEFTSEFDQKVAQQKADFEAKQQKYLEKKSEGMQSLYMAGGLFGSFLLVVFLSIFIKIERNLRGVELKSKTAA